MADQPKRTEQYIGAIVASLGGFTLGTVIGWSSPASLIIKEKLNVTDDDIAWVSSIMPIGAAVSQIYMALTLDVLGRKLSMLVISVPFIIGWLIIAFASSIEVYCVGRFITGFCGGSFCVVSPVYVGEIADKNIRGTLSALFQGLITSGILMSYILGEFHNMFAITVPFSIVPAILFIIMLFLPESPVFLYRKGKVDKAKKAMQFYRGKDYNIEPEMKDIEEYTKVTQSFWKSFKTRACVKAFLMLIGMHAVQQLSGINSVMFYAHKIFEMAGSTLGPGVNAIILGIVQVVFTLVSVACVDRAGRKLLWIISLSLMGGCLILLGFYFTIRRNNEKLANSIAWLPLMVICLYIVGFSFGAGPLPWVMFGEFLPNAVKGYLGSFVIFFNWMLAFGITQSFPWLVGHIGADIVFWMYSVICGAGIAYVILFVIETKKKTLEEIQIELGTRPE